MPFEKGQGGRKPGATNLITRTVKETLLEVFNELQEDPETALKSFAVKYPRDFHQMAARLIPTELTGSIKHIINVTDKEDDDNAITLHNDGD